MIIYFKIIFDAKKKNEFADKPGSVMDSHSSRSVVTNRLKRPTQIQREPHY